MMTMEDFEDFWDFMPIDASFSQTMELDRRIVSILLDKLFDPFGFEVDFEGDLKFKNIPD